MSVQEDKLKEIADAIRAVDGSKNAIPANQFKDRIVLLANRMNVPLTVYVDAGATVKVEQGNTVLTAISGEGGSAKLFLPSAGDWIITPELDGKMLTPKSISVPMGYEESFSFSTSRLPEGYTEVQYIACNTPPSGYVPYIVYNAFMRKTINGKDYGLNAEAVFSYPEVPEGSDNKVCNIIESLAEKYGAVYASYSLKCYVYSTSNSNEKLKNKHRIYAGIIGTSDITTGSFEKYSSLLENRYEEKTKITTKFKPESMRLDIYENDVLVYDSGNTIISNPLTRFSTSVRYPMTILSRRNIKNTFWGKLFYLKLFFEDGTIVGELIPCKRNSDNIAGLYDLVTDEFYASEVNETYLYAGPAI